MHCPFCQHDNTRVIDSRVSEDGATIRRRRECEACGERFSTLETIELKLPAIIKSDGRREGFDARKLRAGFDRSLQKRPVSEEQIEALGHRKAWRYKYSSDPHNSSTCGRQDIKNLREFLARAGVTLASYEGSQH